MRKKVLVVGSYVADLMGRAPEYFLYFSYP